jgi:hypothetical protein
MVSRSFTTMNLAICWFPPLGARTAASRMRRMSSSGIGSGLNRRMERWVKIASPSGSDSRLWSIEIGLLCDG